MIRKALIVGGGIGGMTAAISLNRAGVTVELIDADPQWRVYGAGISVTGISLRAFDDLGIFDEIRKRGFVGSGLRGRSPTGEILFESPQPEKPRPIQQGGGILRPVLHDILSTAVRREGLAVGLGVTVDTLTQDDSGVEVTFVDGRHDRYDLVVGADGIHSQIRKLIFPALPPPRLTGQGCWRVLAERQPAVDRTEMYFGGPVKLGINPVSDSQMYMFILEHVPDNRFFPKESMVSHISQLIASFGGAVAILRDSLTRPEQINYRPLEWILVPNPWYEGRVILIGDAAHATTPHMASGAGLAAEDGIALAQEVARHASVEDAFSAFMERRFERARRVVENSVQIGDMEMAGDMTNAGAEILGATFAGLQAPY